MNINTVLLSAEMGGAERLTLGVQVLIIGMATVFASLAILWGVISVFKILMYDFPEKKAKLAEGEPTKNVSKKAKASVPASNDEAALVAAITAATVAEETKLIAILTAAITAYNAENGISDSSFRVVSYKRVSGANGWTGADENKSV